MLIKPHWPAPDRVHALITTREGGVSQGSYESFNLGMHVGDNPQAVMTNRARLRILLPSDPIWLKQVHGITVVEAAQTDPYPIADASYTRHPSVVCAIQTADCLPILLCNQEASLVAAIHVGWRGLVQNIIENTIHAIDEPTKNLLAFLGPAISQDHFEVGEDVRIACGKDADAYFFSTSQVDKWHVNLYGLAKNRLNRLGIEQIYGGDYCTVGETRFFSYRRDKGVTGRMASLIWLVK